jgi:glycosyltransferase involved in cell wall biosynthesis
MTRPAVWLVSPAWRRYEVTRLVLAQRARLVTELAVRGLEAVSLIVADDENLDIAREYGSQTVEAPNKALGRKCNTGLKHACDHGADYIVWVGSDDWVHPDAFNPLIDRPAPAKGERPPILLGHRIAAVDLQAGVLRRCNSPSRFGAIPWIIHRSLLEPAKFMPLRPNVDRGLDGTLIRGLKRSRVAPTFEHYDPNPVRCVDFKSATNINPYSLLSKLGDAPEESPWPVLAEHYPQDLVDLAYRTHLELLEAA